MTVHLRKFTSVTRPYRLEFAGMHCCTTTYVSEQAARDARPVREKYLRPMYGSKWRITLRAPKGRKTTVVAEGVVK